MDSEGSFATKSIHAGSKPRVNHSMVCPIFQSATYEQPSLDQRYEDIKYLRLNNSPTHEHLDAKIGQLENGTALVLSSGMAAITTSLLALCSSGDHILMQDPCYGASTVFATHDLTRFGMDVTFFNSFDVQSIDEVLSLLRPSTRVIYVESIANPLTRIPNMPVIIEAAKLFGERHGTRIITMIDNTFATPYNFRPLDCGIDVVLHSGTKYLNGHSDICAGVVVVRDKSLMEKIQTMATHLGPCLDPNSCFLLDRGLKTLPLRIQQHNDNALRLAQFLESHQSVARVNYPGLESHKDHARALSLFTPHQSHHGKVTDGTANGTDGHGSSVGCGGMLSFELASASLEAAGRFVYALQVATMAPSLGSVETLVTIPARSSHAGLSAEERQRAGVSESLIRVSVGLEGIEDLIEDFQTALKQV
ncbi:unnamed protein product [Vitrella brassicaformis CCMP3155]|uniref:Cystathionine beta-lyase n=2 Tax=Vitrella brassicaformis TaxID=1169539 RepID=A0A0G4FK89_VITBC|nr:unnamed protein product [Vitrella brassicaformis CCMP3155]|eukprot:CEM13976.1 unnamed protein product [Vitrella brassicaformis CCMP3155]